jgi:hypothetical protein
MNLKRDTVTRLSGFENREITNSQALCELATRIPGIGACHITRQNAWPPNDRVTTPMGF